MPPSKRDELVEAAMRVFERQGFHTSGLDAVLREAGISRMTVYNHFRSKNDLIVAALRRKDECSRHALMTHVDQAPDPASRVRALFDFHERWFTCREFKGCMFLGAAAEFDDPDGAIRRTVAEHAREVARYVEGLCADLGVDDPKEAACDLMLLLQGAIVAAHAIGQCEGDPGAPARRARRLACRLLDIDG
ncbi:MAG: TetR/AcrR family transcriptional regulator [Phycisphaerales bacterium]|nr:TetR/AcrR family transcriptional regulator [Phycisphaerales bacterium]